MLFSYYYISSTTMIITQNTTRNKFDRATFCTLHTQLKFAKLKTRKINSFCYIVVYIESYSVEDVCIEMCVVCSVFFLLFRSHRLLTFLSISCSYSQSLFHSLSRFAFDLRFSYENDTVLCLSAYSCN